MVDFVDLFCGGGLGARGAVMAGCTPVLGVDSWELAGATYKENFPSAQVTVGYVENVDPVAAVGGRTIDLLLASPECTNHSPAKGAAKRSEASRRTALEVIRWVESLEPRWIILENVIQMRDWRRYRRLVRDLRRLGYHIRECQLNAADFGVPQSRERLFLVCDRIAEVPAIQITVEARISARTVLDPPGTWNMSSLFSPKRAANTLARAERAFEHIGRNDPFLLVYYGTDGGGGWQRLDVPLRTVTTLDRFALVEPIGGEHRMRMLQPPELARAMGLPPDHKINQGSRRDRVRLCGNGICAPVIQAIVEQAIMPNVQ